MPVRLFLDWSNRGRKTHPNSDWHQRIKQKAQHALLCVCQGQMLCDQSPHTPAALPSSQYGLYTHNVRQNKPSLPYVSFTKHFCHQNKTSD